MTLEILLRAKFMEMCKAEKMTLDSGGLTFKYLYLYLDLIQTRSEWGLTVDMDVLESGFSL